MKLKIQALRPLMAILVLVSAAASAAVGQADDRQPADDLSTRSVAITTADGVAVHGDLYEAEAGKDAPLVLLFHQAGSNAAEYATIAPRLAGEGMHCLAVDQRAGGRKWGRGNRTVAARGKSATFLEAYPDLEATVAWAGSQGYTGKLVAWGSSYSAALVFRLAAEHDDVDLLLAFSPGEYLGGEDLVAGWAARVKIPVMVISAPGQEVSTARPIFEAVAAADKVQIVPRVGVHGSSTLRLERNPEGHKENWRAVLGFLQTHLR